MLPPFAGLPPRILSPAQVDTFIRTGWLVIVDVIPAPLVAAIRPLIEARLAAAPEITELRSKPWAGYLLKDSPAGPSTDQVVNPRYRAIIDDLCASPWISRVPPTSCRRWSGIVHVLQRAA